MTAHSHDILSPLEELDKRVEALAYDNPRPAITDMLKKFPPFSKRV